MSSHWSADIAVTRLNPMPAAPASWIQVLGYNALSLCLTVAAFYLCLHRPDTLLSLVYAATLATTLAFLLRRDYEDAAKLQGLIKVWCELPLGLGALLWFGAQAKSFQDEHLEWFTVYVNVAVLGNVAMMVLLPSSGTRRGPYVKLACVGLTLWLTQQMMAADWRTVRFENGRFVFVASSLPWIASHAVYRVGLISLPSFDTWRYAGLELASLGCMWGFHRFLSEETLESRPLEHYFGMADTLVVATTAVGSKLVDLWATDRTSFALGASAQRAADRGLIPLLAMVVLFSAYSIWMAPE